MPEHIHDTIRRIATMLTHDPAITDAQIIGVARVQGCKIPLVGDLNKLTFMENFVLGKHMILQAQIAGLSYAEMSGQRKRGH